MKAMTTLLFVPPDTRPPTLDFPLQLARAAGLKVLLPDGEALPDMNRPGDKERLKHWLHAQAGGADLLILSLETLCLGGMIPARRVDDSLAEAEAYLDLLPQL
nr:DUF4127 family protein [Deinococcota bacterium]